MRLIAGNQVLAFVQDYHLSCLNPLETALHSSSHSCLKEHHQKILG